MPADADLVLALELEQWTLGACEWNSRWIRGCYGDAAVEQLGGHAIVCTGTIYGTARGFALLARLLGAEDCPVVKGMDQGMINVLFRRGALDEVAVVAQPRGKGMVNTIGPS